MIPRSASIGSLCLRDVLRKTHSWPRLSPRIRRSGRKCCKDSSLVRAACLTGRPTSRCKYALSCFTLTTASGARQLVRVRLVATHAFCLAFLARQTSLVNAFFAGLRTIVRRWTKYRKGVCKGLPMRSPSHGVLLLGDGPSSLLVGLSPRSGVYEAFDERVARSSIDWMCGRELHCITVTTSVPFGSVG